MLMRTTDQRAESANLFLRQLSREDRALIADKLERMTFERGAPLFSVNDMLHSVYFPETVIVSIEKSAGNDLHIETALIGNEGVVGWTSLVGGGCSMYNAVVQMKAGTLLRISVENLLIACASSTTLFAALMRFIEIVMVQMSQAIVSHLHDPVERRICRWLLMRHDRSIGDHLVVKHDEISGNLGVRRASVTDCLHILEGDHLLRCYRGKIVIRDRQGLEARAADAYGLAEDHYRLLIGPFGQPRVLREIPKSVELMSAEPNIPLMI